MNYPKISVIIPTYRREELLRDTVADTVGQDYPDFEVLVVDQTASHKPEIEAYLQQQAEAGTIQWFRVSWASLPGARNYGVRRAKGEIILFIDDDVRLEKGFLQAHARNYERPEIGAVAGRVLDRMILAQSAADFTVDYLPKEAMDAGIAWYYLDLVHTVKPQQVISARGCNMSFRREIFEKYGLSFDERFGGSAVREESDFCLHVRQTPYKIWYDPEAFLVHLSEPTGGCHDISTKTLKYQLTHYHNHFWMAFKSLTFSEGFRLAVRMFDCHVLGNPPCNKSGSFPRMFVRGVFYFMGFMNAVITGVKSIWDSGQIYTKLEK